MRNEQIAYKFANGYTKGKTRHLFIEDDIIYSYGYHFPIAKRFKFKNDIYYLFNTKGYSNTTSRHKSRVLRHLPSSRVINIKDCDIDNIKEQYKFNGNEIKEKLDKIKRARNS